MNKILIAFILLAVSLTSCSKFLEEQSQSEIRPSNINDLKALMGANGYPYQTALYPFLSLMTDDVKCNGGQGQANYEKVVLASKSVFSWSKDMYQELLLPTGWGNTSRINTWQMAYGYISGCNTVLEYIDKVTGSDIDKNNLRGQALTMRAYYYFLLVNLYGKPYNAPGLDLAKSLGVPLRLRMVVTDSLYPRNTIAEVYTQIEKDLKDGLALLNENKQANGIYKMSPNAAQALLSRMYLYQENWEQSIAYADAVIADRPELTQLNTYKAQPGGGYNLYNNGTSMYYSNRIYDPFLSKEIIWAYQPILPGTGEPNDEAFKSYMFPGYSAVYNPPYSVSDELLNLYDNRPISDTAVYLGDLRSRTYILTTLGIISYAPVSYFFKFVGGSMGVGGGGIRTAELYLNRAEAKIQLAIKNGNTGLIQEALNDINKLRSSRYDKRKSYTPITITDPQQLLSFCKDERRREFPFEEGHRWFDLRRYGMPAISHFYEEVVGTGEEFKLAEGDSRYTLQIPKAVLERNGLLSQNP